MCTYLIRRYVFSLGEGEIFTTRDCLRMGSRGAVDMCLSRMVKDGTILRLASGVFVRQDYTDRVYTIEEIAKVKANSFGKELLEHGANIAIKLGLKKTIPNENPTFYTNGRTSYFHTRGVKVKMHGIVPRKGICPGDNVVGHVIRALWHMGRDVVENKDIQKATNRLGRTQTLWLDECVRWMPEWLSSECVSF